MSVLVSEKAGMRVAVIWKVGEPLDGLSAVIYTSGQLQSLFGNVDEEEHRVQ